MAATDEVLVGVDPGSHKCGLAVVAAGPQVTESRVVPADELASVLELWLGRYQVRAVVLGGGTGSKAVAERLAAVLGEVPLLVRDEAGTTLLARRRYWEEHPPRGLWRLIPTTLRTPPEPYDDLVAALLAEREWATFTTLSSSGVAR